MEKIKFGAGFRRIIHKFRHENTVSTHGEIQTPKRQNAVKSAFHFSLKNYPSSTAQVENVQRLLRQHRVETSDNLLQNTSAVLTIFQPKDGHSLRSATLLVNPKGDILEVIGKRVAVPTSNVPGSGYKLIERNPSQYFTNPKFQERFRKLWQRHTNAQQTVSVSGNGSNHPITPPVTKPKYVSRYEIKPLSAEWRPSTHQ